MTLWCIECGAPPADCDCEDPTYVSSDYLGADLERDMRVTVALLAEGVCEWTADRLVSREQVAS